MSTNLTTNTKLPSDNYRISDANSFYNYFIETYSFNYEKDGIYTRYNVNPELGDGYMEQVRFENGLEFCTTSLQLKHSISLKYHLKNAPLEIHYMLDGNIYHHENIAGSMNLSEGKLSVFFCSDMKGTMTLAAGRKITFITIMIGNQLLENLLGVCQYNEDIQSYRKTSYVQELLKPHNPTAEVKAIFAQISSCSLTQFGKSVFFQGKAAELVAYIWEQGIIRFSKDDFLCLHSYEITALEQAKELIENNLIEPASIEELANTVGLNIQKFKIGFKQLYETTPYQYLIRCRMLQARTLLCDKGYSVTDAATSVGYTNISYFSRIFRGYYGQSPKNFRFGL